MWAPLKFLLFPIKYRFPSFLKKNQSFHGQDLPDTVPGHGLQLTFCSYRAMQWVILALTASTGHSDSWDIHIALLARLLIWEHVEAEVSELSRMFSISRHLQTVVDNWYNYHRENLYVWNLPHHQGSVRFRLRCFWSPRVSSWSYCITSSPEMLLA